MSRPSFLADENVPLEAVRELQAEGYDITAIHTVCPGASDEQVLALGAAQQRIVVTFDRDFALLVFRRRLTAPPGVVFLRIRARSPEYVCEHIARLLGSGSMFVGRFTVATETRIRSVPLP